MNQKQFSVVVCTKNEEGRINDCLKSIYLNTPSEVILVDGGSTDKNN